MIRKIALFLLLLLLFVGCRNEEKVNKLTFSGMGTVLSVIYTGKKDVAVERLLEKDVRTVENELSYYKKESFVSIINADGFKSPVKVPEHVCKLVKKSLEFGKRTDGVFNITYKSQGILWEKNTDKIPADDKIATKNDLVGLDLVKTDCKNSTVSTLKEGVLIDLGGIAKGYAIDRAGEILRSNGKKDFIINYGGDMLVCGSKGRKKWSVGIKNPQNKSSFLKKLEFGSKKCHGIATSGDYERFIEINGKKYSHIFDPRSGKPVKGARSITVVATDALTADAVATAVSVGHEDGFIKKIMEKFPVKIYTLVEKNRVLEEWE